MYVVKWGVQLVASEPPRAPGYYTGDTTVISCINYVASTSQPCSQCSKHSILNAPCTMAAVGEGSGKGNK